MSVEAGAGVWPCWTNIPAPTNDCSTLAPFPLPQAPEVLSGARPTAASDAFSYGVVLWELLTWRLPWDTTALTWQIAAAVAGGKRLEVPPREALPGDDTPQARP